MCLIVLLEVFRNDVSHRTLLGWNKNYSMPNKRTNLFSLKRVHFHFYHFNYMDKKSMAVKGRPKKTIGHQLLNKSCLINKARGIETGEHGPNFSHFLRPCDNISGLFTKRTQAIPKIFSNIFR